MKRFPLWLQSPKLRQGAFARLPWLAVLATCGCQNEYLTTAESDVVVTFVDEGRDYSGYKTYLLPDTVVDLCGGSDISAGIGGANMGGQASSRPSSDDRCQSADHSLDAALLTAIAKNLDELGYRRIVDPMQEEPDLAVFVGVIAQDNWFVDTSPGYCYPYYYYWGCWYPAYTYAYNLPTNAYVIDMADTEESQDGQLSSVWTAALQGLQKASSEKSGKQRISEGVDQAFAQSPYLADGGE